VVSDTPAPPAVHSPALPTSHRWQLPKVSRVTIAVLIPAALVTIAAMIWLWPSPHGSNPTASDTPRSSGQVVTVHHAPCPVPDELKDLPPDVVAPLPTDCGTVDVRLTDGTHAGQVVTTDIPAGIGAPTVADGDNVVLIYTPDSLTDHQYQIVDHKRGTKLWIFAIAFALAVIGFGRWRGLASLAGLAVTFVILLMFIVPAILDDKPPLLTAIVGSAAIMIIVLYLTQGLTTPTSMAVLGTLIALTLTGILSAITTAAMKLTGVGNEEALFLSSSFRGVDMRGLLLAGILIGALGVLNDMAVTQAYTVDELATANPTLGFRDLYRAASRIGRAHIAAIVNTIVLAYAGASLPLLLLIAAGNQPVSEVLTSEALTEEIIRSGVGTIGLITAVPITTALAALAARPAATKHRRRNRRPDPLETAWGLDRVGDTHSTTLESPPTASAT
jgi:uncharacterized membrane protein